MAQSNTSKTPIQTSLADKRWFYRFWEIFPGLLSWLLLLSPIYLSFFWPIAVAYLIIAFDIMWLLKSVRMSFGLVESYNILKKAEKIDWVDRLVQLQDPKKYLDKATNQLKNLSRPYIFGIHSSVRDKRKFKKIKIEVERLQEIVQHENTLINPNDVYHVIITAVYNESLDVLKPSIEAVLESNFDPKKIIYVLAYEERGGEQTAENARILEKDYSDKFGGYLSVCHPDGLKGEIKGKGANISFAGRIVKTYLEERSLDPEHAVVTTLDSDHRPDPNYLPYLTYEYCINPNRTKFSYQPMAMFFNNIWDAPAPMRRSTRAAT